MSFGAACKGNAPLTDTERTKVVGNVFPVALWCKVCLVLDANPWIFLLLFIVLVPVRAVRLIAGKSVEILQRPPVRDPDQCIPRIFLCGYQSRRLAKIQSLGCR